jgi:hypothetical protein
VRFHELNPCKLRLVRRTRRLRLLALGYFFRTEFCDASNQLYRDGVGQQEADCTLVDRVRCKLVVE